MIDLGLVGRLTPHMREKTIDLMIAAVQEDYRGIADALYAIGTPTRKIDRAAYEAEVATPRATATSASSSPRSRSRGSSRIWSRARRSTASRSRPDFLLVGKALMTIEGVGKEIYPELDVFEEMKPYFMRLMWARYSPERLTQDLVRTLTRISGAATDLPDCRARRSSTTCARAASRSARASRCCPVAVDVLGRRIYSGLVVAGLLDRERHPALGGEFYGFGGHLRRRARSSWGAIHSDLGDVARATAPKKELRPRRRGPMDLPRPCPMDPSRRGASVRTKRRGRAAGR